MTKPDANVMQFACLGVKESSICGRRLNDGQPYIIHRPRRWFADAEVAGEILNARPIREWAFGGWQHIKVEALDHYVDLPALGLTPLGISSRGTLNLREQYEYDLWELIIDHALFTPVIERGNCLAYEMEHVACILDGNELADLSALDDLTYEEMHRLRYQSTVRDLRCLDAHAAQGYSELSGGIEVFWKQALRYFQMGVGIGDLTLGPDFGAALPWEFPGNRPYLRCLQGLGLAAWHLGDKETALEALSRLVWLDPADSWGARFVWDEINDGVSFWNSAGKFVLMTYIGRLP